MRPISVIPPFRHCNITLFGRYRATERNLANVHAEIRSQGGDLEKIARVQPPSGEADPGFKIVMKPDFSQPLTCEGTYISEPGETILITSRDCPLIVLENRHTGKICVVHAGRPALSPPAECPACSHTVIKPALDAVLTAGGNPGDVYAFITASICAKHFTHERKRAQPYIAPFQYLYGDSVFLDAKRGELNLVKVIKQQLVGREVPEQQIVVDNRCTVAHTGYSSKRANKAGHNLLLVTRK